MAVPLGPASPDANSPLNFLPILLSQTDLRHFIVRVAGNSCTHVQEWFSGVSLELRHYRGTYILLYFPRFVHHTLSALPRTFIV